MTDARMPVVQIRPAEPDDAPELIAIRSRTIEHELDADEFIHHLGIPHGDDYFCLVAELEGSVVGYLSAGGSRDDDRKSFGEFYEIAIDPRASTTVAMQSLLDSGLVLLMNARYGGVITWVATDDVTLEDSLRSIAFVPDAREREGRDQQRRFAVTTETPSANGDS